MRRRGVLFLWTAALCCGQGDKPFRCNQDDIDLAASKLAKYPVLITGTSRSGTHLISSLFLNYDFDLPHEMLGEDGSVSWL